MPRNGKTPTVTQATRDGKRLSEKKRKEQKLLELATDLAIDLYGPALKELEKH